VVERTAATVFLDLEDWAQAARHAELAQQHSESLGQPVTVIFSALALAQACCMLGQRERAEVLLSKVVADSIALQLPVTHSGALLLRAEHLESREPERQALLAQADELARASGRADAMREVEETRARLSS
jgi:hypothetical protein